MNAFRTRVLVLVTCLVLLLPSSGADYVEGGGEPEPPQPPPPGPSYGVAWDNVSFTEVTNPLARFKAFPVYDPDGDLITALTPVSRTGTAALPPDDLSSLTNGEIADAIVKAGLTKQALHQAVNAALAGAESAAYDMETAMSAIDTGDFSLAVRHLRSWLRVTLVCGSTTNPHVYEWVAIIPAPIDCAGSPSTDELVMVVDVASLTHEDVIEPGPNGVPVPRNDVPDTAVLALRSMVNLGPLQVLPTGTFVMGFSFKGNGVGITARLDQLSRIDLSLTGLASSDVPDEGRLTFTSVSTFNAGVLYHLTMGSVVSRNFTVSPNVTAASGSFSLVFRTSTLTNGERSIDVRPASAAVTNRVLIHADQGAGDILKGEYANPSIPFSIGVRREQTVEGGVKHSLAVDLIDGHGRPFSELRATSWEGTQPRGTFYIVGLPSKSTLTIDHGTAGDEASSINIQGASDDSGAGWFRTIALDARTPFLPWNQTVSDAGRVYVAVARENPTNSESVPFVYQSIFYHTDKGISIVKGDGGIVGVYDATMVGIDLGDEGEEFTDWVVNDQTCSLDCLGALDRGQQARGHTSSLVNYTFASFAFQTFEVCGLVHEGTQVCV